jgi:hypothetical protein
MQALSQEKNKASLVKFIRRKLKHASSITDFRKIELMLFYLKTQPRPASDSKWIKEYLKLKQLEVEYLEKVFKFLQSIRPQDKTAKPEDKVGRVKVVMFEPTSRNPLS